MVGIFGGKNAPSRPPRPDATTPVHSTPPPPYVENARSGPVYATETTTTTTHVVTTTTHTTTTHFFSLPLWRKRTPANSATNLNRPQIHASPSLGELGMMYSGSGPPMVLLRDKDLPPTPSPSNSSPDRTPADTPGPPSSLALPGNFSQTSINGSGPSRLSAPPMTVSLSEGVELSQSATLLARAALGLGLQPMLNQLASSSTTDLNGVSFISPLISDARVSKPNLAMRRAKSFQKDPSDHGEGHAQAEVMNRRRTRGLSLGPLHFGSEPKAKGKEKEKEVEPEARQSFQKSLVRKASFWSRKRYDSQTKPPPDLNPHPGPERTLQPSLPTLQPVSPFRMDTAAPVVPSLSPEYSSPLPSPELQRRHSERGHPQQMVLQDEDIPPAEQSPTESKSKRRRPRRPQTADTADSHRRRSSSLLYTAPPPLSSSPPSTQSTSSPPASLSSVSNQSTVRPRASTNPPFLQRLSINLFGSPSISSSHPASTAQTPSSISGDQLVDSPPSSVPGSSRPSISRSKHSLEIPKPRQEEESPELYLHRLLEAVSKAEVATVLASSPDEFHARALRTYIERFDFSSDPLDVALRRLLMDVGLPRETQQIDRVMEAFAARYLQCHMNLFTSDDHPYVLAFSLIMLHTDAFNKSNKRKMSKADYVRNTRLPGVAPEVLDCFYDNIVFAPFIFIEDPLDVNGQRGLAPDGTPSRRMSTFNASSPGGVNGSSSLLGKSSKIDPYYLITRNLLDDLRVNVQLYVPLYSPYVYQGTGGQWDDDELLRAFQTAGVVEVSPGYYPTPWFSLSVGGGPGPMTLGGTVPPPYPTSLETFTLKVTKVGILWRKDEILEGGRKPLNRKWKEWSVLLTGSQLLLCRDLTWVNNIQAKIVRANGEASLPYNSVPKPDELLIVKDTVAVFDKSYTKYRNVLRLIMPDGRQVLFQAPDERQMNEWIARINYASAFKTAGVRMRSLGMSGKDIELTGQAAAASHLRDVQNRNRQPATPRVRTWGGRSSLDLDDLPSRTDGGLPAEQVSATGRPPTRTESVDSDSYASPMENPSKLFKATFDQVKQDLAAGRWQAVDEGSLRTFRPRAMSLESSLHSPPPTSSSTRTDDVEQVRSSSRSRIIRSKISELETKLSVAQSQLDSDMRFVHNIAVLTPFQRATRERLQAAVQAVSKRVMQVRLDIEKLRCHRDVLARDLVAEERDWQRTKKMALRAATLTLQSQDVQPVPRMTLSVFLDDVEPTMPRTESPTASPMTFHRPESSAAESFHSALEYSSDYDDLRDTSMDTSRSPTTPSTPKHPTMSLSLEADIHGRIPTPLTAESSIDSSSSTRSRSNERRHSKYVTAPEIPEEEAEEWNKTRAAKRVSLVKLPSDIRMSVLFGKHEQNHRDIIPEDSNISTSSPPSKQTFQSPSEVTQYNPTKSRAGAATVLDRSEPCGRVS